MKCDKQSRTIPYPMGVCSVLHRGSKIAIYPNRFRQDKIVFIGVHPTYNTIKLAYIQMLYKGQVVENKQFIDSLHATANTQY